MTALVFGPEQRNSLFLGKFKYALSIRMPKEFFSAACTNTKDYEYFLQVRQSIHVDHVVHFTRGSKSGLITVFSSDCSYLQNIADTVAGSTNQHRAIWTKIQARQAVVSLPSQVVFLAKPGPWRFRTRLSERRITPEQLQQVRGFFQTRLDQFRLSPRLKQIVTSKKPGNWLQGTVDHQHDQDIFLLNLVVPNLIRYTCPIHAK
jgi:hypothetical protein